MDVEITAQQLQQILRGVTIPPQPQIMIDLQMEQLLPNCSINSIAWLISQDVGLAGSLLKIVNSPFFGLPNKITSIAQAVGLLGINSVINMVNAQSIKSALSDKDIASLGSFWDSAIDIAQVSLHIARKTGFEYPDEAYSLGLFHNCGIALMMKRFKDYGTTMQQLYAEPELAINTLENNLMATNHCVVGYYIAKSWKLPDHLCEAIHQHHQFTGEPSKTANGDRKKTLLAILKLAEHVCGNYKSLGKQSVDHEWNRIESEVLEELGLNQRDYKNLKQSIYDMGLGFS